MRVLGRGSAASIISVILAFTRFGAAISLFVTAFAIVLLPFLPAPNVSVTVPVSFMLDASSPVHTGRPTFAFEIERKPGEATGRSTPRLDRVDGSVTVPDASKGFIAANAVVLLFVLALALFVIDQLRAVLRTLIDGHPFDPANATHIRRVGLVIIFGELARAGVVHAENVYAMTHVATSGLRFDTSPHVSVWTLIYGLVILVIAEVFRAGTRLDQEQSLTV